MMKAKPKSQSLLSKLRSNLSKVNGDLRKRVDRNEKKDLKKLPRNPQNKGGDESSRESLLSIVVDNLNDKILAIFISVVTFVVFVNTMHPSLPGGDSGELITAAHETGVAHPPGYPLFTILSKLFILLVPAGSVAWRVSLLSVVCGSLASCFIYLLVHRLTAAEASGVLGSCMFTFSLLVWTWSGLAEVFSLNNLLLAMTMFIAAHFEDRVASAQSTGMLCTCGALVCGLCLSNQHTSILYIAVIVPWVFYLLWINKKLTMQVVMHSSAAFACGLLPYVYLPVVSSLRTARWTWGDQTTVWGLLTHVLRMEYGTLDLLKDHSGQGFLVGLKVYLYHLRADYPLPFLMLFPLSLWSIYRRQKAQRGVPSFVLILWVMLVAYLSFFCWRANLDVNKPLFFKVVERFWLQSDLIVCILCAVAFGDLINFASKYLHHQPLNLALVAAIVCVGVQVMRNWSRCDHINNRVIEDFARQSLEAFPPHSIILTKGDLPSNSFRYFHLCENVRKDLQLFDQEVLTYPWSIPTMGRHHPNITFSGDQLQAVSGRRADGTQAFTFLDFIDANYLSHPIFACIGVQEYDSSWQAKYSLRPYGVCWQLVEKAGPPLDMNGWLDFTSGVTQHWDHPWHSLDDGTWEFVANSEMWRARTADAFFLLEKAIELPDQDEKAVKLLHKSYELYTKAFHKWSKKGEVPSFWHRNYAIVCERLVRGGSKLDSLDLLRKSKHHFEQFLVLDPDDPDADKIKGAVESLQAYLEEAA